MKPFMQPGKYNRVVSIERLSDPSDDSGGQEEIWTEVGTARVEATPIGGKELLLAGALHATQAWRLETWWRSDVTTADRLAADWLPDAKWRITLDRIEDPDGRKIKLVMFGTASQVWDAADPVGN